MKRISYEEAKKRFNLKKIIWAITKKNPLKIKSPCRLIALQCKCFRPVDCSSMLHGFAAILIGAEGQIDIGSLPVTPHCPRAIKLDPVQLRKVLPDALPDLAHGALR